MRGASFHAVVATYAAVCRRPDIAIPIYQDIGYRRTWQSVLDSEGCKCFAIVARQAGSPGADPDIASAILEQATDIVQCRASCRVITGTVGDVEVRKTVLLNGFLLLANVVADTLKIAFAGITAAQGSGAFAEILVADSRGGRQPHFSLLLVSLNGDQIAVDYALPTVVTEAREESTTTPVFPLAQGDRGVDAVERWTSHEQIRDGVMSETVGFLRAYLNPFNSETVIWIGLRHERDLRVRIYDVTGRLVRILFEGSRPAGQLKVVWDGMDGRGWPVATGSYLAELAGEGFRATVGLAFVK